MVRAGRDGTSRMTVAAFAAGMATVLASPAAAAGPSPAGASSCSGCHAAGSPVGPLAGLPADRTMAAMIEFRSGARASTVMGRIAKGFSDDETRAIAEWLSGQEPER